MPVGHCIHQESSNQEIYWMIDQNHAAMKKAFFIILTYFRKSSLGTNFVPINGGMYVLKKDR